MVKLTAALLCAGCFLLHVSGQEDFDLADALDTVTKQPVPATKRPAVDDHPKPQPYPNPRPRPEEHGNGGIYPKLPPYPHTPPQPGHYGNSGDISDIDLNDGNPLPPGGTGEREHISNHGGNTADSSKTAEITSPIVLVLVVLAAGSVFGYTAYKKKQYCFKPRSGANAV